MSSDRRSFWKTSIYVSLGCLLPSCFWSAFGLVALGAGLGGGGGIFWLIVCLLPILAPIFTLFWLIVSLIIYRLCDGSLNPVALLPSNKDNPILYFFCLIPALILFSFRDQFVFTPLILVALIKPIHLQTLLDYHPCLSLTFTLSAFSWPWCVLLSVYISRYMKRFGAQYRQTIAHLLLVAPPILMIVSWLINAIEYIQK